MLWRFSLFLLALLCLGMKGGKIETGYSSVVRFKRGAEEGCAGTFIGNNLGAHSVMVTAGHCLVNRTNGGITLQKGAANHAASIAAFAHPNVILGGGGGSSHLYDLAYVIFPSRSAISTTDVQTNPGKEGDSLYAVAWGVTGPKMGGATQLFEMNHNKTGDRATGYLIHEDDGALPDTPGESGSPLFKDGKIIGVLMGCKDGILSRAPWNRDGLSCGYSSIFGKESLETLARAMAKYPKAFAHIDPTKFAPISSRYTRAASSKVVSSTTKKPAGNSQASTQPASKKTSPPPANKALPNVAANKKTVQPANSGSKNGSSSYQAQSNLGTTKQTQATSDPKTTVVKNSPPPPTKTLPQVRTKTTSLAQNAKRINLKPRTDSAGASVEVKFDKSLGDKNLD